MDTPNESERRDAPPVPAGLMAPGSVTLRLLKALRFAKSSAETRTDGLTATLKLHRSQVCKGLQTLREAGLIWFAGRSWVAQHHALVALEAILDQEDAERAFDQAHDAYVAAYTSGDAQAIADTNAALERASARLDALAPVRNCTICNEPVSQFDSYLGLTTHARCESMEAAETMTDEEFDAVMAEKPLGSREAA